MLRPGRSSKAQEKVLKDLERKRAVAAKTGEDHKGGWLVPQVCLTPTGCSTRNNPLGKPNMRHPSEKRTHTTPCALPQRKT